MKTKEHLNPVKDRYPSLNLTFEQAEKISQYEQYKDDYPNEFYFSYWEERDYELSVFKEILNADQFVTYENSIKKDLEKHEQDLAQKDAEKTNGVLFYEEQLAFYEQEFLPSIFKDSYLTYSWLEIYKNKVTYLRNEYQEFLNENNKEMLALHFRHNRMFTPNELKMSLLDHAITCVFPSYKYFEPAMDRPTRAVADFLEQVVRHFPDDTEQLLDEKLEELKAFHKKLQHKHYGDTLAGNIMLTKLNSEIDEKTKVFMSLLLIDPEKYKTNHSD